MCTNTNTMQDVHWLPRGAIGDLDRRLEQLARRARKLGLAPIRRVVVGEREVHERDERGPTGRVRIELGVRFEGEAPRLAGHAFLARLEHTKAGNVVAKAPGAHDEELDVRFRTTSAFCDHCKTERRRQETFVLRREVDGALLQVGRDCLQDYLRGADPASALKIWTLLAQAIAACADDDEGGGGGGRHWGFLTRKFVAAAFRDVSQSGWKSRREHDEGANTASVATFACSMPPRDGGAMRHWQEAQPTEDDYARADAAIAWAASLEGRNDYEHNLRVTCSLEHITHKHTGIVASVTVAYLRHCELEFKRKRDRERCAQSKYFGEVGHTYLRRVTITKARELSNDWGVKTLFIMVDAEGHMFKWWATGTFEEDLGDERWAVLPVVKHETYQGIEQTVVKRAVLHDCEEPPAVSKWIGPNGEIFKTKKAMVAAASIAAE